MTREKLLARHPELQSNTPLLEDLADYMRTLQIPYPGTQPCEPTALIRYEGMKMGRDIIATHLEAGLPAAKGEDAKDPTRHYSEPPRVMQGAGSQSK